MHDVASDCKTGEETDRLRVLMGQIVIDQDEGPRLPNPVLAPGPFQPVIDFSGYDNDLLNADPHQERLTIGDISRITELAFSTSIEDAVPADGGK